jgi:hypothetical protein
MAKKLRWWKRRSASLASKKIGLIGDWAAIRDTYLYVHQSMKESRIRLQGARVDLARRKRKVQRDHPREFAERGNESLGTAQPRARILVEGACYLAFACRDLCHPPNLQG